MNAINFLSCYKRTVRAAATAHGATTTQTETMTDHAEEMVRGVTMTGTGIRMVRVVGEEKDAREKTPQTLIHAKACATTTATDR